ncbi:MAG: inosine monophosphate cyclohydrolase [Firmicutes bacterium HGW-Firmicutes-16]|nr:MAG: inosine monophosphate cyclohydrolase [Firmicutes bacterium HGW-Firmicutes-16]
MATDINDIGEILRENEYPGRGVIIGKSMDGKNAVFAYFIMGRSENSRNRVFVENGSDLVIHPFDSSKVEDPSLIIYSPVRSFRKKVIVTNGDQTDTIFDFLANGDTFENALDTRCFEPDEPNYTPRISGFLDFENAFSYKLSILKAADASSSGCNRFTFSYSPVDGVGHFIHTYAGNGKPIPSFFGEPEVVGIGNDIDEYTNLLWDNLDADNKVSLYVRFIDIESGAFKSRMINKNV